MNEKQIESFWNKVNIKSENEFWELVVKSTNLNL